MSVPHLRLFTSYKSPFCLKVMMFARELGIINKIVLDYSVQSSPIKKHMAHDAFAPHGKIPCLVVDGTEPIFGSDVICQYLSTLAPGKNAYPEPGTLAYFQALTTEALTMEMQNAALLLRYERLERPKELHWNDWIEGQLSKITRSIPVLAKRPLADPEIDVLPVSSIATAICLWYMDKRAADSNWRELEGGAQLDSWLKRIQERQSWKDSDFP